MILLLTQGVFTNFEFLQKQLIYELTAIIFAVEYCSSFPGQPVNTFFYKYFQCTKVVCVWDDTITIFSFFKNLKNSGNRSCFALVLIC